MPLRYLVGPVKPTWCDEFLHPQIASGHCETFDVDPNCVAEMDWDSLLAQRSANWIPDVLFVPHFGRFPQRLWQSPTPIVALIADWRSQWHMYRRILRHCDLVLTDPIGVEALRRESIAYSQRADLFGLGRSWVDFAVKEPNRDIDVLFIAERLSRFQHNSYSAALMLMSLCPYWKVLFISDISRDDYRRLLMRSRIVINQDTGTESHRAAAEAIAAAALFFQQTDRSEVFSPILRDREECVRFDRGNLLELLTYYLEHENERRQITEMARHRLNEFTFSHQWETLLTKVATELPSLRERAERRRTTFAGPDVITRCWIYASERFGIDPPLTQDLTLAVQDQPRNPHLHNALGVLAAPLVAPELHAAHVEAATAFQNAWRSDPRHIVAGLNLAEVLVKMGQRQHAEEQARRTLDMMDEFGALDNVRLDAPLISVGFDELQIEWERAAWKHPGQPESEAKAKERLLRWRLHYLLAELRDDLVHAYSAWSLRPDSVWTLSLLGRMLVRKGHAREAIPYLREAAEADSFAADTSRALHEALGQVGQTALEQRFATQRRRLSEVAPTLVLAESWFAAPAAPPLPSRESMISPLRIVWHGPQDAMHSLALVNREICVRLAQHGHELSLLPPHTEEPQGARVRLPAALQSCRDVFLTKPAEIHISHQWPPDFTPPNDGHWIVMQPWEFGSIPRAWLEPITHQVDEIWVPSHFVRDCFMHSGVPAERVHVVPNGVSELFLRDGHLPYALQTTKRYKFLFVGGTIERKGIDLLLKAFSQTFCGKDNVCLVIKDMGGSTFYEGQTAEQLIGKFRHAPDAPEIEYLNRDLSDDEMARLYAACDCLVHPYRGEGFGLPIAEAMACGLPVIVTGYGAALDFCHDEHAYLLPARVAYFQEKRVGEIETVDRPWCAEPDVDQLRYRLRYVMEFPAEAKAKGNLAQAFIRAHFTWDHTVASLERRLQQIRQQPIHRLAQRDEPASVHAFTLASWPKNASSPGRVSLAMIVKNEEANLAACLESVADLVNEIVIIDTGSTDGTKEIAGRFGAKVADFPWVDNFSAARNESLRHATGEWIFWMDADDRLDEENRRKLRELFQRLPHENLGFVMKCLCLPEAGSGTATVVDHIRLFRNHPLIRWKYRIHEQILPAVRRQGGKVEWSDIVIHHVGYQKLAVRKFKLERDLRLLMMEYQEQPDDPFTLFNLGSVYQEQGKTAEALDLLRRSLQRSAPEDSIVRKLYALIIQGHRQLKQMNEAAVACDEGRRHYPDDLEILFQESMVRRDVGDRRGAIANLERILSQREDNHFASVDTGLRGYKTRHNLALFLQEEGRYEEAEKQWQLAIAEQPNFVPALAGLAEIRLKTNDWPQFDQLILRLRNTKANLEALSFSARKHLALGEFAMARKTIRQAIALNPDVIWPHVLLTHILLQEGTDWAAAEAALRDVLARDPNHAEARRNLDLLMQFDEQKA